MALHIVGVRHHSPACARLVERTIEAVRPRFVLIEGPSDINDRINDLHLGHRLPIAVFSYAATSEGASSSWTPFCDYSPEWVAASAARAYGADAFFVDLPAWHGAFSEVKNRYADRISRTGARQAALCEAAGVEDSDALWDHLFELPARPEDLRERLRAYFEGLRRGETLSERDAEREAYMARWIAWAMAECRAQGGGSVVVVCGGFHAPALELLWQSVPEPSGPRRRPSEELEVNPDRLTLGSYLVPYSFRRLDSFVGYEAGMPSPAFYQAVWEQGPEAAAETMLFRAVLRLREKKQLVSPADAIAAGTAAHGLKSLRGHAAIARVDVLDGLASALVKDALDAPLPWSRRGKLLARTDPMLVEIVAVFSGDRTGELAKDTPRPPLVSDAFAQISAVAIELSPGGALVEADVTDPKGIERSRVLHRLRLLEIPGFTRVRAAAWGGSAPAPSAGEALTEAWAVKRTLDADAALIEAAAYGATLEAAAAGRIEDLLGHAPNLAALAELLLDAALAGVRELSVRILADVRRIALAEPSFAVLGRALSSLLALYRYDVALGAKGSPEIAAIVEAAFDRGLWLIEGINGPKSPLVQHDVEAVFALRDALLTIARGDASADASGDAGARDVLRDRAFAVMRRRSRDPDAVPSLRGAALGFLWSSGAFADDAIAEAAAVASMRAAAEPETFGDYLVGLFALAREEVQRARALVAAADASVRGFSERDFLLAAPSLRLAFSFFPPREKERIAGEIVALHEASPDRARELLSLGATADTVLTGRAMDRAVAAVARRFGLDDELDEASS